MAPSPPPHPLPAALSLSRSLSPSPSLPDTPSSQSRLSQLSSHLSTASHTMAAVFSAANVPQAPEDPLFGLMRAYRQDPFAKKVDLGIGAYRDDHAKPWILPVVRKADEILRSDPELNHEYLPIAGLPQYTGAAQKLILGADSPAIHDGRVATFQTISGTGAVHLGALFLAKFHPLRPAPTVYLSDPTWANHNQIFTNVGLQIAKYPYFSAQTKGLDIDGLLSTLLAAPAGSIIVLHACAHNPTGVDPTHDQWKQIATVIRERGHFPFFDCAYQGFASGDLARDAWAIRYFVSQGFETCVAQSFAKNFGLYGERAGAFHWISAPDAAATSQVTTGNIASQLAILQRSEISNPPAYGSRIASIVLNDPQLFAEWEEDLRTMSGRIAEMRLGLRQRLEARILADSSNIINGSQANWAHITSQIGMFSFTGLSESQVKVLREKWHIYMTKNGRISMAGINSHNIDYVAEAIDSVIRETA
ncbi:Aspartate aminotransferase, cytoplasmic [Talaromyces atroroseus]|uniref:Aspartate aminotransferase n=1 Tax=Talaromyces atroroseus TaxID=1441469 RepID=A0A225ALJ7_TALAT|nr:Aspartate aminotransferase, cytoplasmic [Talaromyces atroroseus]OKL62451.1 Aspartate aminotransferase, cytoplasmic [Talaromyces atroroseus]